MRTIIQNGLIVRPDSMFKGSVLLEEGRIKEVTDKTYTNESCFREGYQVVDADGSYVLPGLVDVHCDLIEKVIEPRKKVMIPISLAILSIQPQLLSAGITSMFHAISFDGEDGLRSNELALEIVNGLVKFRKEDTAIMRHFINVRYELANDTGIEAIYRLIEDGIPDFFTLMDHSPQYGKYKTLDDYKAYIQRTKNLSGKALEDYIRAQWDKREAVDPEIELWLLKIIGKYNIVFGTHDDITPQKLDNYKRYGSTVSEFPLNEETARHAINLKMFPVVGAPNVLKNKSHQNNLSARQALINGMAKIICSDYYPFALLASVFILFEEGVRLSEAVNFASIYPARATGLAEQIGSLEEGKKADILLVHYQPGTMPYVRSAMVDGKWALNLASIC